MEPATLEDKIIAHVRDWLSRQAPFVRDTGDAAETTLRITNPGADATFKGPLTREAIADALNVHPNTKSFANGLGRLRGLGLVEGLSLAPELRG